MAQDLPYIFFSFALTSITSSVSRVEVNSQATFITGLFYIRSLSGTSKSCQLQYDYIVKKLVFKV